jgi:peptide/nickel transport system permease protein
MTIDLTLEATAITPRRRRRRRWYTDPILWIGGPLLIVAIICLIAPLLPLSDPNLVNLNATTLPPFFMHGGSWAHPLGTSNLGQDLLSQLIWGGRTTIIVGFLGMLGGIIPGVLLGLTSGYNRGIIDSVISRLIDAQLSLPFILVALAIIASRGHSIDVVLVVLALTTWPHFARVVRAETLSLRERPFVMGLKASGASSKRILFFHIFPNLATVVMVMATLGIGAAILIESAIDFLGLGITAPGISWGSILATGQSQIGTAWWIAAWPGVAIGLFVLFINLLGDELVSRFDPRHRKY